MTALTAENYSGERVIPAESAEAPVGGVTALIADDLTGAAEVAGITLGLGVPQRFFVGIPSEESLLEALKGLSGAQSGTGDFGGREGAGVVVIALDSRSMSCGDAVRANAEVALLLRRCGVRRVFKKTDSAMRGWILPEMRAIASVMGYESLLIEPANPVNGRTIRGGVYYVGDLPIGETPFAADPEFPAFCSDVRTLLEARDCDAVETRTPADAAGAAVAGAVIEAAGAEASGRSVEAPASYSVPDCVSVADLGSCLENIPETVLCGGSAGFWKAWLEKAVREGMAEGLTSKDVAPGSAPEDTSHRLPLDGSLMICGSAHPSSAAFVEKMAGEGCPMTALPAWLLQTTRSGSDILTAASPDTGLSALGDNSSAEQSAKLAAWADEAAAKWALERHLLVHYPFNELHAALAARLSPVEVRARMTLAVTALLKRFTPSRLLIEGGSTAYGIFAAMGWNSLIPIREWRPGVVDLLLAPALIITLKPGSYPWPDF